MRMFPPEVSHFVFNQSESGEIHVGPEKVRQLNFYAFSLWQIIFEIVVYRVSTSVYRTRLVILSYATAGKASLCLLMSVSMKGKFLYIIFYSRKAKYRIRL